MSTRRAGLLGAVVGAGLLTLTSAAWACVPGHDHTAGGEAASTPAAPAAPPAAAEQPTASASSGSITANATSPAATSAATPAPSSSSTATNSAGTARTSTRTVTQPAATPAAPAPPAPAATATPATPEAPAVPVTQVPAASTPVTGAGMFHDVVKTSPTTSNDGGSRLVAIGLVAAGGALLLGGLATVTQGRKPEREAAVAKR